jgi:uncharacterized protein with HEPN domain
MLKDDFIRILHMLDAAKEAISFSNGKTRNDLDGNRMLTLSIIKSIEIIGEAASKVTNETRDQLPEFPSLHIPSFASSQFPDGPAIFSAVILLGLSKS